MSANPNTDTRSPWYECFEPQAQVEMPAADTGRDDAAPLTAETDEADSDVAWCLDALFDYYNA